MGLKEDLEYCLNNGKCTECKYGNAQSMLICRCLVDSIVKEQTPTVITTKYIDGFGNAVSYCPLCYSRLTRSSNRNYCGECGKHILWDKTGKYILWDKTEEYKNNNYD